MKKAALLLCALLPAAQAQDIEFKSTEVAPGVYLLDAVEGFGGGNVTLQMDAQQLKDIIAFSALQTVSGTGAMLDNLSVGDRVRATDILDIPNSIGITECYSVN